MSKKVLFVVMDGVGISKNDEGDAVKAAGMPNLHRLIDEYPHAIIKAHGTAVGLPSDEDMGNSEVGHNALGCGQIYSQGAKRVDESIEDGTLFESETFLNLVNNVKEHNSTFHFLGLLSDGNVHSNISHLIKTLEELRKEDVKKARIHILLDGRDTPPQSATIYVQQLEDVLAKLRDEDHDYRIASGGGRMVITMDRYKANWDMVKLGYETHVLGRGKEFKSAMEAIETYRNETPGIIDQDLPPFVIADENGPIGKIVDNDSVLLFNFRGDRALEISLALDRDNFDAFEREYYPHIKYAGMLQYDADAKIPTYYLVTPPNITNTLTEQLVKFNKNELAISETQKFGHVTYFWNGNKLDKFDENLETYIEIPSDVISFDQKPEMKAREITEETIKNMKTNKFDFIRINFPNGDMVGHTGNYEATITAMNVVDECVGKLYDSAIENGYTLIVTADHGNAEEMYVVKDGKRIPKTSHTTNPVYYVICDKEYEMKEGEFGLSNSAATIADILGVEKNPVWNESMIK